MITVGRSQKAEDHGGTVDHEPLIRLKMCKRYDSVAYPYNSSNDAAAEGKEGELEQVLFYPI